jgi:hypothetical protein
MLAITALVLLLSALTAIFTKGFLLAFGAFFGS